MVNEGNILKNMVVTTSVDDLALIDANATVGIDLSSSLVNYTTGICRGH